MERSMQDEDFLHREPTEEMRFYIAVAKGDVDSVRKNCQEQRFLDSTGVGTLSKDPLQNIKYHFVISTAMVTRYCAECGMEFEKAFRLSDFYILKLDDLHTVQEVAGLHDQMVMDFVRQMKTLNQRSVLSRPIND